MNIDDLKLNKANPRQISEEKFKLLLNSIKSFDKMMELRPIIIDENNVIIGGNMRYRALQTAGYLEIPNNWVKQVIGLTDEEKREFIIKDNIGFGDWDWDIIANEWDQNKLIEWGFNEFLSDEETRTVKDLSLNLETNFRIEVILNDEKTQELLYNELISRNYECRLLTL